MTQSRQPYPKQPLTLVSRKIGVHSPGATLICVVIATAGFVVRRVQGIELSDDPSSWAILLALAGLISLFIFERRYEVEIDSIAQRLTITRYFMLRWTTMPLWTTVVEHCAFDECSKVGTVPKPDDPDSYGLYLDFKRGGGYGIPLGGTLSEASRLAAQLSAATGIPRRDLQPPDRSGDK